jgi:hypothetical protein
MYTMHRVELFDLASASWLAKAIGICSTTLGVELVQVSTSYGLVGGRKPLR